MTGERLAWARYAAPCIAVWSLYLATYWPGVMSNDSIDQWRQMTTWELVNYQPAAHTLTNWLITRAWESPAAALDTHRACVSSLVWQVPQPAGEYLFAFQQEGIVPNDLGLAASSRIPSLHDALAAPLAVSVIGLIIPALLLARPGDGAPGGAAQEERP